MSNQTWLVTGGCGFIGSCFIRSSLARIPELRIVNLDKLTYAGRLENLIGIPEQRYVFQHAGIEDSAAVASLLSQHQPSVIINFAAESHVDRSIDGPAEFLQTNVIGTITLLEQALSYFRETRSPGDMRLVHVSTDEVYGTLGAEGLFSEANAFRPNSPYAASKASSDMFVRAFHQTYGLPTLITNCSNNYGPRQFPEKLIPLMILNALESRELPVYGDGMNVRDWLYVEDHCEAIRQVIDRGRLGETYNIGGESERTNLKVVQTICDYVDQSVGRDSASRRLIRFVDDRPGHDRRYAIDTMKIRSELGWRPTLTFEEGLRKTVDWYLNHPRWVEAVSSDGCHRKRLGRGNRA